MFKKSWTVGTIIVLQNIARAEYVNTFTVLAKTPNLLMSREEHLIWEGRKQLWTKLSNFEPRTTFPVWTQP